MKLTALELIAAVISPRLSGLGNGFRESINAPGVHAAMVGVTPQWYVGGRQCSSPTNDEGAR